MAGKVALGTAIDYALSYGLDAIQSRIYQLAATLRARLADLDGVQVTDEGAEKCGLVTFTARQMAATPLKQKLRTYRINVSTSEGSGNLVSFQQRGLTEVVRASLHYYNTEQEIDYFINTLRTILHQPV